MFYLEPIPYSKINGQVQLRADVFPASVQFSFAENKYPKARAIVTADRVMVLVDGQRTPRLLYDGRLEGYTGDRNSLVATTAEGEITITRAQGCGCGSRLRGFRPYQKAIRMASV